jgi:hypothetical protein
VRNFEKSGPLADMRESSHAEKILTTTKQNIFQWRSNNQMDDGFSKKVLQRSRALTQRCV